MKTRPFTETYWAIASPSAGIYTGTYFTRQAAKDTHASIMGRTWAECRAQGDVAIKVRLTETTERV